MKKKIIILVTLFIVLVIINAPVKFVENYMPSTKDIIINGLQGTVWSGEINSVVVKGWNLSQLDYNLSFISLITGKIGASTFIKKGDVIGDVSFELEDEKNLSIKQANLKIPAMKIESYLPIKGIELSGSLYSRNLNVLVVNNKPTLVDGITEWKKASVNFNGQSYKVGDLKISWQTNSETQMITGTILKTKNILSLEGKMSLDKTGLFDFKGSISDKTDQMIYNAFIFFSDGKAANGRLPIKFKKKIM
jgi:general secretion pathway protein N